MSRLNIISEGLWVFWIRLTFELVDSVDCSLQCWWASCTLPFPVSVGIIKSNQWGLNTTKRGRKVDPSPSCLPDPQRPCAPGTGRGWGGGGLGRLRVTRPPGAPTSAEAGPQFLLRGLVGGENTQKCPPWAGWECWLSPSELPCEA